MITARRIGKWALVALGVYVAAALAVWFGIGIYLSTPAGRSMVARQIQERIGMPVEVQSVSVGLGKSSIGMTVYDQDVSRDKGEVFAVQSATADLSLFDILGGHIAPRHVTLQGVTLKLHVDASGKIITKLPRVPESSGKAAPQLPWIKLTDGKISVDQDGRPPFSLQNLELSVDPQPDGEVRLAGDINDPQWSRWTITGNIDRSNKSGSVDLETDDGPLTMDRLTSIPFVPPSVWEHIRPNGRAGIDLRLTRSPGQELLYTITVQPRDASLTLPQASVTLQKVTGTLRLSGNRLEVIGARAELADGTLAIDGSTDFGAQPTPISLAVKASGLDLKDLPDEWGLPKGEFEGKLQGNANLKLLIYSDGRIETQGGGSGSIADAKFRGIPVSVSMKLVSNGKQFRFESPDAPMKPPKSKTEAEPTAGDRRCARTREPMSLPVGLPVDLAALDSLPGVFISTDAVLPLSAQQPAPPKKDAAPSALSANIKLRNVEISELLEKLNVKLGYKISGKVSAEVALSVPIGRVASQAAYEFTGKVSSPALHLEGLVIRDLSATATYQNGKLTLKELAGKIDQPGKGNGQPGTFLGTAVVQRNPPGDVSASFAFERLPVGELLRAIPGWTIESSGLLAGKAEFRAPYDKISDPTAWNATARVSSPEIVVAGRKATDFNVALDVGKGVASLKNTHVTIEGIPITADASVTLKDKYPFTATLRTTGTDVVDFRKLVPGTELPDIKGVLETTTEATGTGSPFTFDARGAIRASELTLARSTANHIAVKWHATTERLVVSELKANLFGGSLSGSADVPFSVDKGGKFALAFKKLDAQAATAFVGNFPVQIAGEVTGEVDGTIVPARPGQSRVGNLSVDLTAPRLTVQGIPADRLVGKAEIKSGVLDYQLEGKTLGGSFEVKGSYPGPDTKQPDAKQPDAKQPDAKQPGEAPKAPEGLLTITGIELSRLTPELKIKSLSPLRGRIDGKFSFAPDLSSGAGRITITGLGWGDAILAREIQGVLILDKGVLRLRELTGYIAGGELRMTAEAYIKNTRRNWFSISLENVDARRLAAAIPELAGKIDGPLTLVARGQLGREMRGSGTLSLARGTISGIAVADLRVPFDWAMSPGGYGRFNIRQATTYTGTGRIEAALTIDWGSEARVEGEVRMLKVPLRTIVPEVGSSSLFGNGRITGRFVLGGTNVRSVDDLTGTLVARFSQTSVKEIPILQQTIPFLNTSGLVQPFQSGDVRGTLSRGVFRIQRLVLVNPSAQLFAAGTITLKGQIDASVVAHTGTLGPGGRAFQLFGLRLPMIGPIPLSLIQEISDFLSNRTIKLTITGNVKDPVVRLNTAALLSEEAVRFLLARYVVPSNAAGVLGLGFESGLR